MYKLKNCPLPNGTYGDVSGETVTNPVFPTRLKHLSLCLKCGKPDNKTIKQIKIDFQY